MSIAEEKSGRPIVKGIDLDGSTRCRHYRSALDVIAIKMKCCGTYYACIDCHSELARHAASVWPRQEWNQKAVLCGVCGAEMSVTEYLDSTNICPECRAAFNPGCRNHYYLYFETKDSEVKVGDSSR
jgi:uncharacterized CHY-type Zn-finger protein